MRGCPQVLVLAVLLTGCTVTVTPVGAPAGQAPAPVVVNPMDQQGWGKSWSATTCGDFKNLMTEVQRVAFARYLVNQQRRSTVPAAADADPVMVSAFASSIIASCDKHYQPSESVIAAAVAAYLIDEPQKYQPPYP